MHFVESTAALYRPALPEDEPFLYRLFASTRAREWASLALPEREKESLMRAQFEAQNASYTSHYPHSEHSVVLSGNEPAGRIWIHESAHEIKVLDVSLTPEFQRQGIGTQLMLGCIDRARQAGKPLRHAVLRWNSGAIAFYARLGFAPCGGDQFFLQLEWLPDR